MLSIQTAANAGITLPGDGTTSNISIRNNIINGTVGAPISTFTGGSVNVISVENNCFYANGNSNNPNYGGLTSSSLTTANNIKVNPLFSSAGDFHLQSTSPCIGAGINVGLKTDYSGNLLKSPPSIGAYENGSSYSHSSVSNTCLSEFCRS